MSQSVLADTNSDLAALVVAWCDRRALGPLRVILGCYPLPTGLTDDWVILAQGLKTIRAQHGRDLKPNEMDAVVRLQHLAESFVHR